MIKLINLIKIAAGAARMDWAGEVILNGPHNKVLSFNMAFDADEHCEFVHVIYSERVGNTVVAKLHGKLFDVSPDKMAKILASDYTTHHYTDLDSGGIIWERHPVDGFVIPKINYDSREWEPDSTLIKKILQMRNRIENWILLIGKDRFR